MQNHINTNNRVHYFRSMEVYPNEQDNIDFFDEL